MEPSSNSPSVEHLKLEFFDSFRYFIMKTPATFTTISPFLIEKAFTSSIGEVKSIRKMRSGDLFLEASSAKQATALINLQKLAHLDASLYVDDLQISCEGSDMRLIERQLQTAVNNILKWCDTNGHSISASKSCCVHFCRKRGIHPDPEIRIRDIQIP
ncbi:putative RNA-directed DNA polymerase from transposon BS [Trichonephila clavipes]|nr:putative RNA-directed DNA polymerase from transposon BS [Trichonephila clavipes]